MTHPATLVTLVRPVQGRWLPAITADHRSPDQRLQNRGSRRGRAGADGKGRHDQRPGRALAGGVVMFDGGERLAAGNRRADLRV